MTATYTPFLRDSDRVRFHINDTDINTPRFQDEEIDAVIGEAGSWKMAVILLLRNLIMKLSQPDFKADWLSVEHRFAREGYQSMLKDKQAELGLSTTTITARAVHTYRPDSDAQAPQYGGGDE